MWIIAVPEGLTRSDWQELMHAAYELVEAELDVACISVGRTPSGDPWISDPHGHLREPEARALIRQSLHSGGADPMLARIAYRAIVGPGHAV